MRHFDRQHHRLLGQIGWERAQSNSKFAITGIPFCLFLKRNPRGILSYQHQINIFSEKRVSQISCDADKSGEINGPFLLLNPGGFQKSNIVNHLGDRENAFSKLPQCLSLFNASSSTQISPKITRADSARNDIHGSLGSPRSSCYFTCPCLPPYLFQCRRRQLVEQITRDPSLAVSIDRHRCPR